MMRRRGRETAIRPLAAAVLLSLALGACGSTPTASDKPDPTTPDTRPEPGGCPLPTEGSSDTTASAPDAPIEVRVWEPYHGTIATSLDEIVARYNASQPRVKVVLDASAASTTAIQSRLEQSGSGADAASPPAVVVLDASRTQAAADSKLITPAQVCLKGTSSTETSPLPVVRATYTVGETEMAASTTLDTPVLFYNRIHLTRAGLDPDQPPRTLAEVARAAAKIKQAGISAKPFTMPFTAGLIEGWLTGAGVTMVDQDNGRTKLATASSFDKPRTLEIYTWLKELDAAGLVDGLPPASLPAAGLAGLLTQQSSMVIAPATAITTLQAFREGRGDTATVGLAPGTTIAAMATAAGDLDVAPLPGLDTPGRGQVAGEAWYLTAAATSEQRAGAWDFLQYLGNVDNQVRLNLETSVPPSNTQAANDPTLQAVWGSPGRGHWLDTAYTQITNFDSQAPGPLIGPSAEVQAAIEASLVAVTTGGRSPAEAIAATDKAMDDAIRAYAAAHPRASD